MKIFLARRCWWIVSSCRNDFQLGLVMLIYIWRIFASLLTWGSVETNGQVLYKSLAGLVEIKKERERRWREDFLLVSRFLFPRRSLLTRKDDRRSQRMTRTRLAHKILSKGQHGSKILKNNNFFSVSSTAGNRNNSCLFSSGIIRKRSQGWCRLACSAYFDFFF